MAAIWGFIHEPSNTGTGTGTAEEVILTFNESVPASTAINIQDGSYAGQVTPPTLEGSMTITLPASFLTDAGIQALLNGQEIHKGADITRSSSTQVTLTFKLHTNDQLKLRKLT